jgi:Uma2 family endonuclease
MAQPTTEAPAAGERRLRLSYEEFLEFGEETTHAEWVDGEVIVFMPPSIRHNRLVQLLSTLLGMFAEAFDLGEVLTAPTEMRLAHSSREPDVLFVARANRERLIDKRLDGPADLVIEVVSDESVARDRADKFYEYQEGGVPEYWIYDPRPGKERADFYYLDADGRYQPIVADAEGRYHSRVLPGFWLRLEWLRQDPLPTPKAALAEILATLPSQGR